MVTGRIPYLYESTAQSTDTFEVPVYPLDRFRVVGRLIVASHNSLLSLLVLTCLYIVIIRLASLYEPGNIAPALVCQCMLHRTAGAKTVADLINVHVIERLLTII